MANPIDIGSWITGLIPSSGTIMSWLRNILIILGIVVVMAVIFFFMSWKKKNKKGDLQELAWWEEINDQMVPIKVDKIQEIIIPGTSLRVFYDKEKDMWLPRFTRAIRPKLFYVAITPNREIVNWVPKPIGRDMKEAGLDYDHTDMRWAAENVREFIKRNYRDKAEPWWKAYQGVITGAIYILVVTFCLAIILYLWKGLADQEAQIISQLGEVCKGVLSSTPTSGVIQVP